MEKKIRKIGLLCTTAVMACSLVLGAGITAFPKSVSAETASMDVLIGKKTDNVTVTAGNTAGDYLGLRIGKGKMFDDWSAQINATFTGSTSITYLLPNMADTPDVTVDGTANWAHQGNAFSVRNTKGERVATFITFPKNWSTIGTQYGYFYDTVNDVYSTPYHSYDSSAEVNFWTDPIKYTELSPTKEGARTIQYFVGKGGLSPMAISPSTGVITEAKVTAAKLEEDSTAEGTLYFDYADGKLTISSSSYDYAECTLTTQTGNGQIIPFGTVEADLSDGYIIEMHNAPDFGKKGDIGYWKYTMSSSVHITSIKTDSGAFATRAENVELGERQEKTISYEGEEVVDGKNVITVPYGRKLNEFDVYSAVTATDIDGVPLALNGYMDSFDYEGNKAFTEDEEITVTYEEGVSKTYLVDVVFIMNTTNLLTALSEQTIIRTAGEPNYNDYETNSTWAAGGSAARPYSTYGTALVIGGHTKSNFTAKEMIGAKLNGTFFGNSSVTYTMGRNSNKAANAIVLQDAQGNNVLHVMNYTYGWNDAKAFVYHYATQKFYSANTSGAAQEITTYDAAASVAPYYFHWNQPYHHATLSFNYDDVNKQVTVTTTKRNADRTVVTLATVSADLSAGYTLSFITPYSLTEGYFSGYDAAGDSTGKDDYVAVEDNMTAYASPAVLITEINGIDVTGATSEATTGIESVVCDNGSEVAMGEELTFTSNSVYNFGSLVYKGSSEVTVDTAADVSKPGETVAIVSDWAATYEIPLTVKTLSQSLTGVEMEKGAFIRVGQGDTDRGLGFRMNVSAADKALLEAYVGEGKAYASVSYGMIIMPYSYVTAAGVTEETLFGENALYTWKDKQGAGSVEVLQMETSYLRTQEELHYVFGAITELKTGNIKKDFIGVGYVKLTDADGNVEYVVASAYSDTSADANNNIRSAYEVAQAAVDSGKYESIAEWLRTNYLAE